MSDMHLLDDFYVITTISNPVRYASRYTLYEQFIAHMKASGVKVVSVEAIFGDRNAKITADGSIQLRTEDEIWQKESLINIGVSRLPSNWKYVAWIDADIQFINPSWAIETVQQLQHYEVVQMFATASDMGPSGEEMASYKGFAYCHITGQPPQTTSIAGKTYGTYWHPGYAWACTRNAWNSFGGLIDFAILGAADHHMACSLIGKGADSIPAGVSDSYRKMVLAWELRAVKDVRHDIGYVPGHIIHNWHGKKVLRKYWDRWDILKCNKFDPLVDIRHDWQGLVSLTGNKPKLRDDIRAYFRQRNEDGIDL